MTPSVRRTLCTALLATSAYLPCATVAFEVGVRHLTLPASDTTRSLAVTVWYPAQPGGTPVRVGESPAFTGTPALRGAPLADGRFPLVVFSHGSGGRVAGMAWLAAELVKAGFAVAGPDHPGTTAGDSTPVDTPKLWQRTRDLSHVMDVLTTDAPWRNFVDAGRIGVVGFSLGGAAAMQLAGARANLEAYARYCDSYTLWDCAWYTGEVGYRDGERVRVAKVDLRTLDKARFEQSNQDRRIQAAVLVDPGLARAYDVQSLQNIGIPMHFINLGRPGTVPLAVTADRLASLVPKGSLDYVADAVHFSFLPVCKNGAVEFLKSVGEIDPICGDGGMRARADIHAEIARRVRDSLLRSLRPAR